MSKKPKEIKIINGSGENLDISPVYEHLAIEKPKPKNEKEKKIIIPKEKKDSKSSD